MSKLLFDEQPLVVQPSLATLIGLSEAIVIQQMHYWLLNSPHFYDGRRWIYNTYKEWQKQFPFWTVRTVQRLIIALEKDALILTANYNRAGFDNTKWYTLDYEALERRRRDHVDDHDKMSSRTNNIDVMDDDKMSQGLRQNDVLHHDKMSSPIPEITQRLTSETTQENKTPPPTTHAREAAIEIWKAFLSNIQGQGQLSKGVIDLWFKPTTPIKYEAQRLTIGCTSQMQIDWITRYAKIVKETLQKLSKGKDVAIEFVVIEPVD